MDGAQRNDYYESLYPGLMTSSQAAVVASAAADNHATSSPRHQPPNDDELLRVEDREERERAPVATVTVGLLRRVAGVEFGDRLALKAAAAGDAYEEDYDDDHAADYDHDNGDGDGSRHPRQPAWFLRVTRLNLNLGARSGKLGRLRSIAVHDKLTAAAASAAAAPAPAAAVDGEGADDDSAIVSPPAPPNVSLGALLPNLTELNLSFNAISRIEGLATLRQLRDLNLAENSITDLRGIADCFYSSSAASSSGAAGSVASDGGRYVACPLERLNLSGNLLERIPNEMAALSKLTTLRLRRNRLHVLQDIEQLAGLRRLS